MRMALLAAAAMAAISLGLSSPAHAQGATALDATAMDQVTAGFSPSLGALALPNGRVTSNASGLSASVSQNGSNAATVAGVISTLPTGAVTLISDAAAGNATRSGRVRSTATVSVSQPTKAGDPTLISLNTSSSARGPGAVTSEGVEFDAGSSGFTTVTNVGLTIGTGAASSSFRTVILSVPAGS